jgi:hypothetical protein
MAETHTVEVVAPWWLKVMIKEDLGMRQFPPDVSDAAIAKWFSDRYLSVQWVYDWQDPVVSGCGVTLPDDVRVLMYPAGTWVKGSIDVINVDAVYDSTNLESNVYTALFVEEGILAVQRCTHTCAVEIPVCVSGRTAINNIDDCLSAPTFGAAVTFSTTATAGIAPAAGTWTPALSTPPATVTALQDGNPVDVTPSPTTAWTTGQFVQTQKAGASGKAYWDGSQWKQGTAP